MKPSTWPNLRRIHPRWEVIEDNPLPLPLIVVDGARAINAPPAGAVGPVRWLGRREQNLASS